jgi:large subunit ribosomal protein L24
VGKMVKKTFSTSWKGSKKPEKKRKYYFKAPLHVKTRFLSAHLSKELKKKYGFRSFPLRKGDKVKVMRGAFKKQTGIVERVDHKKIRVYVKGAEITKKDGSKIIKPIHPSNLEITELNLNDKKRVEKLESKINRQKQ